MAGIARVPPLMTITRNKRNGTLVSNNIPVLKKAEEDVNINEKQHRFILGLHTALRQLSDEQEIQYTAASLIAEHLEASQANYTDCTKDLIIVQNEYQRDKTISMKGIKAAILPTAIDILSEAEPWSAQML